MFPSSSCSSGNVDGMATTRSLFLGSMVASGTAALVAETWKVEGDSRVGAMGDGLAGEAEAPLRRLKSGKSIFRKRGDDLEGMMGMSGLIGLIGGRVYRVGEI